LQNIHKAFPAEKAKFSGQKAPTGIIYYGEKRNFQGEVIVKRSENKGCTQ
jgi:hypothetical protein